MSQHDTRPTHKAAIDHCACRSTRKKDRTAEGTCPYRECPCACHQFSLWLAGRWVHVGFDASSPSWLNRSAVAALVEKYGRDPSKEPTPLEAWERP